MRELGGMIENSGVPRSVYVISIRRLHLYLCWFGWLERARHSDASMTAMLEAPAANGRHSACREVPLRQDASPLGLLKEEASHAVTQSPLSNRSHIRTGLTAKLGLAILAIDRKQPGMPIGDLMVPSDKTYRSAWLPRLSKRRVLMRCPPRTPKRAPFQLG